jgi:hypothetical protein
MSQEAPKKGLGLAAMIKNFDQNAKQTGSHLNFTKIS